MSWRGPVHLDCQHTATNPFQSIGHYTTSIYWWTSVIYFPSLISSSLLLPRAVLFLIFIWLLARWLWRDYWRRIISRWHRWQFYSSFYILDPICTRIFMSILFFSLSLTLCIFNSYLSLQPWLLPAMMSPGVRNSNNDTVSRKSGPDPGIYTSIRTLLKKRRRRRKVPGKIFVSSSSFLLSWLAVLLFLGNLGYSSSCISTPEIVDIDKYRWSTETEE